MYALEAFVAAYQEHYARLRAIAYNILRDAQEVEDVMQSVMLRLVERQDALGEIAVPLAFLRRSIRNEAISRLRHRQIAAIPSDDAVLERPYTEGEYERVEGYLYVKAYIQKQPPELQEAFLAHVLDGVPIVDLAREMGISNSTLSRKFSRIKLEIAHRPDGRVIGVILILC